jgi:hypothetical protein
VGSAGGFCLSLAGTWGFSSPGGTGAATEDAEPSRKISGTRAERHAILADKRTRFAFNFDLMSGIFVIPNRPFREIGSRFGIAPGFNTGRIRRWKVRSFKLHKQETCHWVTDILHRTYAKPLG